MVQARRLMFPRKQAVELETHELGELAFGQVLVKNSFSLMSTGTENIVFNRLFDPGTHWDDWVKYPFYPGYAAVGTVVEVGKGVEELKPGSRVALRTNHASHTIAAATDCMPIPDGLPLEQALWFALAKIAFHGAQAANYEAGDSVLVIGAGPIGQMSTRWAYAQGAAEIYVVDLAESRMALARQGGATVTLALPIGEAKEALQQHSGGVLPRVVIDSTGNAAVFATALELVRDFGRVVVLGDTGQPAKQALTSDVITRGLTIVGAHDNHNNAQWNNASIAQLFFRLAISGRFPLAGLNSHIFKPEDCAEAYAVANRDRTKTMGIVFDWRD